ncbi:hypothetical protein EIP86_010769 [Pleurotus ostreatoroseus]|nr:hypothetical protein EIP86_010769 [Pleurotus ostreatoroseus]
MSLLTGKVVCITGSSRGIGRATALECAKHGATGLILHYLGDAATTEEIHSLKAEIEEKYAPAKAVTVPGDIADPETATKASDPRLTARFSQLKEGVDAFQRIDVLVSNAGICPFAEFLTMPLATYERTRQVNLDGAFYVTQANQMKVQAPQGGSIIGISSISALVGGELQCCAVALGKYNIRANAILPGTIATDINKEDLSDDAKREYMIRRTCLGRLGAPDDIAGPVVFLASDLAKYVTGASLLVDGGLFVNLQ